MPGRVIHPARYRVPYGVVCVHARIIPRRRCFRHNIVSGTTDGSPSSGGVQRSRAGRRICVPTAVTTLAVVLVVVEGGGRIHFRQHEHADRSATSLAAADAIVRRILGSCTSTRPRRFVNRACIPPPRNAYNTLCDVFGLSSRSFKLL